MAIATTGGLSIGGASSALRQSFTVPSGVTTLLFNYNFVTEEYPEFCGSIFNDSYRAVLTTATGQDIIIAFEDVNSSCATNTLFPVNGIDFPGGDATTGMTGWRIAAANVSQFAGTNELLTFSVTDAGDTIYDTAVLIDEVRFVDGEKAFPLTFPWLGENPYSASIINSILDHFGSSGYEDNGKAVAYNGEEGSWDESGVDPIRTQRSPVQISDTKTLYGFRKEGGAPFSLNGSYGGGGTVCMSTDGQEVPCTDFLFYDGHPGYDYATGNGDVFAAAAGKVVGRVCGRLEIQHQGGYATIYRHMKDYDAAVQPGEMVGAGQRLGRAGGYDKDCEPRFGAHLHFEVLKERNLVDPYGWEGGNPDPYDITSVNLWRPIAQ